MLKLKFSSVMAKLPKHADWGGGVVAVYSVVNTIGEHNFFGPSAQIVGIWSPYVSCIS